MLAIEKSPRISELPNLTVFEKSLIYKYSEDGYEMANETLRQTKGIEMNDFAKLLFIILGKLPDYKGLVYRNVDLTQTQLRRYQKAFSENKPVKEYAFVSTSKSSLIAGQYGGNTAFKIFSRTGKSIDKIAKFGVHNPAPNEQEVLFRANRIFKVLQISKDGDKTKIIMEEI